MVQVQQGRWQSTQGWIQPLTADSSPQVLLLTGNFAAGTAQPFLASLSADFPEALIMGCSTAGQIDGVQLHEQDVVITALHFEKTRCVLVQQPLPEPSASFSVGQTLADALLAAPEAAQLKHVLVLSEGLQINGSAMVKGLQSRLPASVSLSGGLAGDQGHFAGTVLYSAQGPLRHSVQALGLYGDSLQVGCGSVGGWDPFGPERTITRSRDNLIFEMDGQPALELYARYLGDEAAALPASGLFFPLELRDGARPPLVRTILGVDPVGQSLTFAGDMPEGARVRLMKANLERLLDGAAAAASESLQHLAVAPQWALLVSCYGRKMILKQRTEEELEEVQQIVGQAVPLSGFYSYGEVSPGVEMSESELHNQTMTVTLFAESLA